ncbi:hemoglobin embryonic subunit alpha-like [Acipenser oxyrinchus oxyrinchus]|uniref:Hemoglobin embryonic subunit alpha-like n=1 Tax=Acipenser oxyrinchus oxyrinchus TaxID=40147 RepID=A0AAD8G3P2_ACIOX|nr:hemoglobin embryonic subunit alpha-like [Acipenser oxyrinchus oxyrinchus]
MTLSDHDKELIVKVWKKISPKAAQIGGDALARLVVVFPQTKIYFSHFADLSPSSPQIKAHGAKVLGAIGEAVRGIDNVSVSLSKLSELHAYNLRVDPVNFKLLAHTLLVSLSATLGAEFTPEIHLAWDKFLAVIAAVLSEKYR